MLNEIVVHFVTTLITPLLNKLGHNIAKDVNSSNSKNESIEEIKSNNQLSESIDYDFSSMNNRLQYLVNELCKQTYNTSYNIDEIAYKLGLKSTNDLHKIFDGENDCTFELCKIFSDNYPINYNWLAFKKENPFYSVISGTFMAMECLEYIEHLEPQNIYFLRDDSNCKQICIGLKLNNSKYTLFSKVWHLSSHVGGTGKSQIYSFYKLSKILREKKDLFIISEAYDISKELFNDLIMGLQPLSQIENSWSDKFDRSYWWEDFIALDCSIDTAEMYGNEYVFAQKIVLEEIEYHNREYS